MILLLSTILAGLAAWVAIAAGIAVVLGRMIVKRDEQVCTRDADHRAAAQRHRGVRPAGTEQSASIVRASDAVRDSDTVRASDTVRSSADAIERSGS